MPEKNINLLAKKAVEKIWWFGYNKEKVSKDVEQMEKTADNCAILKNDSQYTIFIFKVGP